MPQPARSTALGLRERKRRATREQIAAVATGLFMARGFDAVTIMEIAEAAQVSKATVFNYFPRKEELLLDRLPEAERLLTEAVTGRPPHQTPLAAVRDLLVDLARRRHPFAPAGPGYERFIKVVIDSEALLGRVREATDELEDHLARLFADAGGPLATADAVAPTPSAHARLAAALVVASYRAIYRETAKRQLVGEAQEELLADHERRVVEAFARLQRAIGSA